MIVHSSKLLIKFKYFKVTKKMDTADDGNQNPGGLYGEIIQAGQKSEQLFCI